MRHLMLFFALVFSSTLFSQQLEWGMAAGGSFYSGDLSDDRIGKFIERIRPAGGVFINFNQDRFFTRLGISVGALRGNDLNGPNAKRGLHFRSSLQEASFIGGLKITSIPMGFHSAFEPYVFTGLAMYRFNPEAKYEGGWIELQPLGTEGQGLDGYGDPYSLTQVAIPVGIGLRWKLNEQWAIGVELGGRKLFTDYLDDVGSTPVNLYDLETGRGSEVVQISKPSIDLDSAINTTYVRGKEGKDWYYFAMLNFAYTMQDINKRRSNNRGCPKF